MNFNSVNLPGPSTDFSNPDSLTPAPISNSVHDLLNLCTVKLRIPQGGHGTGFFVDRGRILTAGHLVADLQGRSIRIEWHAQLYEAVVEQLAMPQSAMADVALLRLVGPVPSHPCVLLGRSLQANDSLYCYGYADDYPQGAATLFEAEGLGGENSFIKFKTGQIHPGSPGAPLLNQRTGQVCGMLKSSAERHAGDRGDGLPSALLMAMIPELNHWQQDFHKRHPVWQQSIHQLLVGELCLAPNPLGVVVHRAGREQPLTLKPRRPVYQRPAVSVGLLGRQAARETLFQCLREHRSAMIIAPTGWGKTALVESLLHDLQSQGLFPDGVIYQQLRDHLSYADLLQDLFSRCYQSEPLSHATPEQIREYLGQRQLLLGLEDVSLSADELGHLLATLPHCTLLITTDQPTLSRADLQVVTLEPLSVSDGTLLVEQSLGRHLDATEQSAVASLCQTLDGCPARVLQATGLVDPQQSLMSVAQRLESESLIRQVLEGLTNHQRWILIALAVFDGLSLSADQLTDCLDIPDVALELKELRRRHWIEVEGIRYRLTKPLLADFQRFKFGPWPDRVLEYFIYWTQQHQTSPIAVQQERSNILQALRWAVREQRWHQVLSLVHLMEGSLSLQGQWDAWRQVLEWGLQAAQALQDPDIESWAHHQMGTRALCLKEEMQARNSLYQALKLRQANGDQAGVMVTRHNLSLWEASASRTVGQPIASRAQVLGHSAGRNRRLSMRSLLLLALSGVGLLSAIYLWNQLAGKLTPRLSKQPSESKQAAPTPAPKEPVPRSQLSPSPTSKPARSPSPEVAPTAEAVSAPVREAANGDDDGLPRTQAIPLPDPSQPPDASQPAPRRPRVPFSTTPARPTPGLNSSLSQEASSPEAGNSSRSASPKPASESSKPGSSAPGSSQRAIPKVAPEIPSSEVSPTESNPQASSTPDASPTASPEPFSAEIIPSAPLDNPIDRSPSPTP